MNRRTMIQAALLAAGAPTMAPATPRKPMAGPLWSWSAVDLAAAIRRREITSREATLSAFKRVEEVNPKVNAIVELLRDDAMAAADAADRATREGSPLGRLHGVPVTTKINSDYKGRTSPDGVPGHKAPMAAEDSSPVRNLRRAGAVIIGRTNTPSYSSRYFTENELHGRTYNPWSRAITSGGSSGGAGSAVAVGMGALAHGNDIGGSVRYPAYACGVFGIRPTLGRVPSAVGYGRNVTSSLFYVEGMLARNIPDLRIGLAALAQEDFGDAWWAPAPLEFPDAAAPVRVAMYLGGSTYKPTPPVAAALRRAANALGAAGYVVEEVDLPHFEEAADLWTHMVVNELVPTDGTNLTPGDPKLDRVVKALREMTPPWNLREFSAAASRRDAINAAWDRLFQRYPLFLTPSSWEAPFAWDRDQAGTESVRQVSRSQSPLLVGSVLGLPGLSVPTGTIDGVPTGVQILARRFREDRCLAAGAVVEAAYPMPTPIDPRAA